MNSAEESPPRTLESDLRQLRDTTTGAASEAVRHDPYLATAAALGVGFVLGGGLTPRVRTLLLGAGARFVGSWLSDEVLGAAARGPDASPGEDQ